MEEGWRLVKAGVTASHSLKNKYNVLMLLSLSRQRKCRLSKMEEGWRLVKAGVTASHSLKNNLSHRVS